MKIYFAGSIRGGRNDAALYLEIINYLKKFGDVLTEHVGNEHLDAYGEDTRADRDIHDRDMQWLLESDKIVAEVTTPSLGVGYEIGRAIEHKKPVLCLYRFDKEKRLSAMISGSPNVENATYRTIEDVKKIVDSFLSE